MSAMRLQRMVEIMPPIKAKVPPMGTAMERLEMLNRKSLPLNEARWDANIESRWTTLITPRSTYPYDDPQFEVIPLTDSERLKLEQGQTYIDRLKKLWAENGPDNVDFTIDVDDTMDAPMTNDPNDVVWKPGNASLCGATARLRSALSRSRVGVHV